MNIGSEAWEASITFSHIIGNTLDGIDKRPLRILDVGSGIESYSLRILTGLLRFRRGTIGVMDPAVHSIEKYGDKVHIVDASLLHDYTPFDVITVVYAMSHICAADVQRILSTLAHHSPTALILAADYTLQGVPEGNARHFLLQSDSERQEHERMGDRDFLTMHTRYTLDDLIRLHREHGWRVMDAATLDAARSRGYVVATSDDKAH